MLLHVQSILKDLRRQWVRVIFILVQLIVCMSLFSYIVQTIEEYQKLEKKMTTLTKNSDIYMFNDRTEEFRFNQMINEKQFIDHMIELNQFISSNTNIIRYIADSSYSLTFPKEYLMPSQGIEQSDDKQQEIDTLKINDAFISTFALKGTFNQTKLLHVFSDYTKSDIEIPIIMGCSFQEYYKTGDIIYDFRQQAYKVYGFLEKGSYYIAPNRFDDIKILDGVIIMPCAMSKDISGIMAAVQFLSSYYATTDKSSMYKIMEKSKELDLFSLGLYTFKERFEEIQDRTLENIVFNGALLSILLCFAMVGFVGNIIQYISDSLREFSINLLCGASELQIVTRIGVQISGLLLLSDIVPFIIYGVVKATLITVGFSVLLGVIIMIYPIIKINSQSICTMIRRSVE